MQDLDWESADVNTVTLNWSQTEVGMALDWFRVHMFEVVWEGTKVMLSQELMQIYTGFELAKSNLNLVEDYRWREYTYKISRKSVKEKWWNKKSKW